MTLEELCRLLFDRVPSSLSCEWDNDGLMLTGDASAPVHRVLCTLDVTEEAVDYAIANHFDLILSHHPLIFKPLSAVTPSTPVARKAIRLLQNGISVVSMHTRADAVADGVNDRLCELLGLEEVRRLESDADRIARVGWLPVPMSLADFCSYVKEQLGAPAVLASDAGHEVSCVAVCGGDGKDYVEGARAAGADTYLSGRIGYHQMTDAPELGINMVEAGHYYTETHITEFFADLVQELLPEAVVEEFASNVILCL